MRKNCRYAKNTISNVFLAFFIFNCSIVDAGSLSDEVAQSWQTDGVWYFFEKEPSEYGVSAYVKRDFSDLLLVHRFKQKGGLWIKSLSIPKIDDYENLSLKYHLFDHNAPNCNDVSIDDIGSAKLLNLFAKIIIRDYQSKTIITTFSIFHKLKNPLTFTGVISESHYYPNDGHLIVTIKPRTMFYVLSDCSIAVNVEKGLILFDKEGNTKAELPTDLRIIRDNDLDKLEQSYYDSLSDNIKGSILQKKIYFYDSYLFGVR